MKLKLSHILVTLMLFALMIPVEAKDFSEEEIKKNLPKMLGANNVGREFYFSFVPCWETGGAKNDLKLYISSGVETLVTVEVKEKGYEKIKKTIPNDIIEFTLAPAIGQPYRKTDRDLPEPDQIWLGAGIHVIADDPIICYGVTRYQYTSDGFLAIPVPALGKEYIAASYADPTDNRIQWLPSFVSITAAYDKTKVRFTMGGTDWSTTGSGQRPGEVSNWNMNEGDVLLFGSLGAHAELTGSKIEATKPVAVVSGNFCAYIPTNCGCCDVIEEMELPTTTWGTEYHVTKIIERKKNSMIKIFAKEPKTNISRDFNPIGFIRNAGGVEGVGHLAMRADEGDPRPIVITGDKPISVTQFNTGQQDDNVPSDPFQLVLTPLEQYQKEIIFNTPGIRGGFGFPKNYINICYEATPYGTIPEDLEFAQVIQGDFEWQKLMDLSPNPGVPFKKLDGGKTYYSKTMLLPGDGVYKLRSSAPFAAYAYGFSSYDSYGFPTSVALGDLTIVDTVPPEPLWEMDCEGNVNNEVVGTNYVSDKPDDADGRSNLSTIYMHSDVSYNYKLYHGDFMPCEDQTTAWSLETIDPTEDALGVVTFADCAGNDTTLFIEYNAPDIKLIHKEFDFGRHSVGEMSWEMFHLINYGTGDWICEVIDLKQKDLKGDPQGFTLWTEDRQGPLQFPITIPADDTLHFWVQFDATAEGTFWDSVGYGDDCFFFYKSIVEANVGMPIIDVSDWNFPKTNVGGTAYGQFDVKNLGSVDLIITGYTGPSLVGTVSNDNIYKSGDLVTLNLSDANPLIIAPGKTRTFELEFHPDDMTTYPDAIPFISNTIKTHPDGTTEIDSICLITGEGIQSDLVATSYNWERKRIHRPGTFPTGPYPANINAINPDTCIRLTNGGNTDITILNIIDKNQIGDVSAFQFNKADLINQVIPGGGELIVSVYFQPTDVGIHTYTFEYQTSNSGVVGVQTTLQGIGIVPHTTVNSIDFGKTIINDFTHAVTKQMTITNETLADWQWGDSVTITGLDAVNAYNNLISSDWETDFTEPFRFDEDQNPSLAYPIVLQPGESVTVDAEFAARQGASVPATITTESDAETEAVSDWVGAGLVPSSNVLGDNTTICLGMADILEFTVTNDGDTDMLFNNFMLSNTADFEFVDPTIATDGFSLASDASRIVEVRFTANTEGAANCDVTCDATPWLGDVANLAPWNIQLTETVIGNTTHYERTFSLSNDDPKAGDPSHTEDVSIDDFFSETISLEPGADLNGTELIGFNVRVEFDGDFLKVGHDNGDPLSGRDADRDGIVLGSVFDEYNGEFNYRITNYDEPNGILDIVIERDANSSAYFTSPNGGEFLHFMVGVYLPKGNNTSSDFTVSITPIEENGTCVDFIEPSGVVNIDRTCVFDIRKLVFGDGQYVLSSIRPNPVTGNEVNIEFEVANDNVQTTIEVYNSANQLVSIPVNQVMQSGRYEVTVPVQTWASGAYTYIMKAGPYEETRMLIIQK